MDFIIADRKTVEAGMTLTEPHIVISIRDVGSSEAAVPSNPKCHGVLYLAFDDAEPSRFFFAPLDRQLFTLKLAERVWTFVHEHKANVTTVVVHCEKGLSRSPAIAAALCKVMGGDEGPFFRQYDPNKHVFRMMLRAASMEGNKEAEL